jgi:hypothetical protein
MPDDLYMPILNSFIASSLWGRVQELYKYVDYISQATCALFIVVIANRLFLKLPDFLTNSQKPTSKTKGQLISKCLFGVFKKGMKTSRLEVS